MKNLKLLVLLSIPVYGFSQATIDGLVRAERTFAAYAVSHGMKPAFLQFADSNGIMFDKGKPVNAIQIWNTRETRAGILNWFPDHIEIAASHDFGYTTGPDLSTKFHY